jgi:hypothetical protein
MLRCCRLHFWGGCRDHGSTCNHCLQLSIRSLPRYLCRFAACTDSLSWMSSIFEVSEHLYSDGAYNGLPKALSYSTILNNDWLIKVHDRWTSETQLVTGLSISDCSCIAEAVTGGLALCDPCGLVQEEDTSLWHFADDQSKRIFSLNSCTGGSIQLFMSETRLSLQCHSEVRQG